MVEPHPRSVRTSVCPVRVPLFRLVGFLVCVEIASGILQGYYTPIFSDIAAHLSIADADVNWFEAAQLMVSALAVPLLARLGDLVGHKNVLLASTAVTALASWGVAFAPNFWTFLVAWALQGFYVVWLPLEVAIIHNRTKGDAQRTRVGAGLLVAALEVGVIVGAGTAGALAGGVSMTVLLAMPAVAVSICLLVIALGVPATPPAAPGRIDWAGFACITAALAAVMTGLVLLRVSGPGSVWPWLTFVVGIALFTPLARLQRRTTEPLVDLAVLRAPGQWPIQLAAALFGASVLGAQIPLSTFARTDPDVTGYGLGASAGQVSILIAGYVLAMAAGAGASPLIARLLGGRGAMVLAAAFVATGYLLFIPLHASLANLLVNMLVVGLGSGALVAALPAAAADAAPRTRTGFATGMTNTTKTIGGAIASSVFAIALASAGDGADAVGGAVDNASRHASLSGYYVVWAIAGATALVAALVLMTTRSRSSDRLDPLRDA